MMSYWRNVYTFMALPCEYDLHCYHIYILQIYIIDRKNNCVHELVLCFWNKRKFQTLKKTISVIKRRQKIKCAINNIKLQETEWNIIMVWLYKNWSLKKKYIWNLQNHWVFTDLGGRVRPFIIYTCISFSNSGECFKVVINENSWSHNLAEHLL